MDVEAILAHPQLRQGPRADDHGLGGPAGARLLRDRPTTAAAGLGVARRQAPPPLLLVHGLPAVRADGTAPRGARRAYAAKGFEIVGLNADRVLEVPYADADRAAYAKKHGWAFTLAHMTPEMQEAYGAVSVFPTLFFVDRKGTIVKQLVNFQEKAALEGAVQVALQ